MVFKTCSYGTDLDPDVYVLLQRVMGLRRHCEKNDKGKARFKAIFQKYEEFGYIDIFTNADDLAGLKPAPPSGSQGRGKWAAGFVAKGPIGLLLHTLHLAGAMLDKEGQIRQDREEPLRTSFWYCCQSS